MKYLITGSAGFIGSHLAEYLLKRGAAVYALDTQPGRFLKHLTGEFRFIPCSVLDATRVLEALSHAKPDIVIHLAAQSLPTASWNDPAGTFQTNVIGTLNLLDGIRAARLDSVIEVVCSSGEYAMSHDGAPIGEDFPLEPQNPYALSKVAQDQLCHLYVRAYQMHIIRVRPFFVIGPRKVGDVCSDFSRGIVDVERGRSTKLRVGDLRPVRDFLDVRDAVAALELLADSAEPGSVYNICSGAGHSIGEVLEQLRGLCAASFQIEADPSLLRPLDEPVRIGDNRKLRALGWQASVSFADSLKTILEYWRAEVHAGSEPHRDPESQE